MRILGLILAGALALTASMGSRPGRWVRAGIQCPTVGTVTGVEHPAARANGTADRFRRVGARIVLPAGGPAGPGPGVPTYWVWDPSGGAFDYPFCRLARPDRWLG